LRLACPGFYAGHRQGQLSPLWTTTQGLDWVGFGSLRRSPLGPQPIASAVLIQTCQSVSAVGNLSPHALPLVQAAQNAVPVAVTAGDKIEALRQWASGQCLLADRAGVYSWTESGGGGGRLGRVVREPGVN